MHLFARSAAKGASLRVDSSVYAASQALTRLVHGQLYSEAEPPVRSVLGAHSRTASPEPAGSSDCSKGSRALSDATEDVHQDVNLFLPLALSTDAAPSNDSALLLPGAAVPPASSAPTRADIETLVAHRNLFAFLLGQSLVATERTPDLFSVFVRIADLLEQYQFSNVDGSSFGEAAASSFASYTDELNLADVRASAEKTIEAIVLGERMRSLPLFTEGFVHGVGKLPLLKELQHPKFDCISPKTTVRMARAAMDLEIRLKNVRAKLTDFEFPEIFAGLMNSKTSDERKVVQFNAWKTAFHAFRKHVLAFYKARYGAWPPKAGAKKHTFATGGLHRRVLLDVYRDMTYLYDLLVDRARLTTRTADGLLEDDDEEKDDDVRAITRRALRRVLSEFDRSHPPVLPPIPFDLPLLPGADAVMSKKQRSARLKDDDARRLLAASHNAAAEGAVPFLASFRAFERKQAAGRSLADAWDQRNGQWLFMYAVLQCLPMVVVDAPGVRCADGVEYFLCEPPRSGVPWARDDTAKQRTWFGVAGGSHVVHLPADVVEHGVDGIYRRSHCWKMAEQWTHALPGASPAVAAPPAAVPATMPASGPGLLHPNAARGASPHRKRESVVDLGLEALPLPAGVALDTPASRPVSRNDPSKTFDAILQSADLGRKAKR